MPTLPTLTGDANADSVAAVGKRIAERQEMQTPLKEEVIGYLGLLAGIQLDKAEVHAALGRHPMVHDLWKHSSITQDLIDEGRMEGRMEEAREMAQIALEDRFGTLSDDVLAALKSADEAMLKSVITAKSLEQVHARLGLS